MKLIHDICITREINRRPAALSLSQGERDGLDCMNFLFDLINESSGYTSKYYNEIGAGKMNHAQMEAKYRAERSNVAKSELLGDHHPHCLLVIEGIDRLYRLYRADSKKHLSVDYLDSMILRLNTGCQGKWFRNHFPVVFETNMSRYFNE